MRGQYNKYLTIMVIPHSARPVLNFHLPLRYIQIIAAVVVIFWLVALVLASRYHDLLANLSELERLRALTRQQEEQLKYFNRETENLQQNLLRLRELERRLREMTNLPDRDGSALPGNYPLALELSGRGGPASIAEQLTEQLPGLREEVELRQASLEDLQQAIARRQARLAATPSIWPVRGQLTSRFGFRSNPLGRGREFHAGYDIAAPYGTRVLATADGQVIFAGWQVGFGRTIIVDHGYGFKTFYGHNSRLAVTAGQSVEKGQVIAYVGSTGRSTGPHLHYEVWINGQPVDPGPYLDYSLARR